VGPVEFLVLTFPGTSPGVGAVTALAQLRESGEIRVIDTLLVAKGADGDVTASELSDVGELAGVVQEGQLNLIDAADAEEVGAALEPGTCALLALVEQTWASRAAAAVRDAGGDLAFSVRIPRQFVDEALAAVGASS
jgi:uncharacterized membrane protein